MSDAAEQRVCEEDFGSEEGEEADVESYLEDNSSELMDRLRELEVPHIQREAYERCLDEVANHVVQALLNQKDLREECIKLKMLVYDLERQNRALCELFQQKLPNHPTTHYQFSPQPHSESKQEPAQTEAQAKVSQRQSDVTGNGFRSQHASPARGPPTSMEALSPFFKKKAHILEVLRKMEETDPLKCSCPRRRCWRPRTPSPSSTSRSTRTAAAPAPRQPPPCRTPTETRATSAAPTASGVRRAPRSPAATCATPPQSPPPRAREGPGRVTASLKAGQKEETPGPTPNTRVRRANTRVRRAMFLFGLRFNTVMFPQDPDRGAGCSDELTGFSPSPHLTNESGPTSNFDPETSDDVNIPERDDSGVQEPASVRAGASVSPSPSCLSDVKSAAINSPSKLLKFLKIPSITEKTQANPNTSAAVRLSPQLTRNSRIPCRTNNYEVYHSPVPTRRATTTERCRQPPPPPSRSESYPAAHSAPTSPPQSDDALPEKDYSGSKAGQVKMAAPSSSSSAATAQPVPHYENVADIKASQENDDFEKRLQAKSNGGERKLVKSLPEAALNERKQSSSSTTESTSDDEEDSDSPVWVNHHSLPACQPVLKAQGTHFARPGDRLDAKEAVVGLIPVVAAQPPPPARRTESSSIPKRPGVVAVRSQGDPSHHAFKERLAALGKLRSSDDLQVGLRQVELASSGDLSADKSNRTVDRQPMEAQKEDLRYSKYAESTEGKPKVSERKYSTQMFEQGAKAQQLAAAKQDAAKLDVPKSKIGLPSPITDAPQVLRNNIKCPVSLNIAYNVKPQSTNSPNKIPPKSPSKPCPPQRVSKPPEAPRYSSKSEERAKMGGKVKKAPMFGDSLPPPPPKPPVTPDGQVEKKPATSPQSAIEQKVMKGIEENMLKELKEQDKVGQVVEVKQKASNGIASWFGLKKSKLPALNRKTDAAKGKEEKTREWKINIPSVGRDSVKVASRCKEGVEGLNISTLMEKAEGLRRALEEERQFVERQGRGHSCEVVMDQSQGQLAVMYRGGRSDNFMQQLLNRAFPPRCWFRAGAGLVPY
uniref:NCK-associated protein 5-like n=1 Tax=Neogobius melanostomus TaxID=47308 RepID=A0A8C6S890_9GOBI